MNRSLNQTRVAASQDARGFTLVEVAIVCAILGILAMLAFPSMRRFGQQQDAKASATQMAGLLEEARSRAISEATPHLVYVNPPSVNENGECGAAAELVRDTDRSYSITDGDDVREFSLPEGACEKVKAYGESGGTPYANLLLPTADYAVRALDAAATGAAAAASNSGNGNSGNGNSGNGNSGSGSGSGEEEDEEDASVAGGVGAVVSAVASNGNSNAANAASRTTSDGKVADAVVNGSTFPLDEVTGRPVIAFSERGIPVDPADPTNWGSGAGAIYLTDGAAVVYAAVVQPMGGVQLRAYDPATGEWR